MELEGKLKVSFPYSVSEETNVYIYGGMNSAGAKGMRKAAGEDALKIYGIEVTSGTDGIEAIKDKKFKFRYRSTFWSSRSSWSSRSCKTIASCRVSPKTEGLRAKTDVL